MASKRKMYLELERLPGADESSSAQVETHEFNFKLKNLIFSHHRVPHQFPMSSQRVSMNLNQICLIQG